MPNLTFRTASGQFYWTFQHFMFERAKIARRARASVIRTCWPLSIVRTVLVCAAVLTMCCVNEKQSYSRQTVTYGKGCVRKDLFSIQNSISTLQALMHMLGGRHQVREDGTRHRNTKQVLPRGVVQWGANRNGYCLCCSDCVFLIGYLLACGSVEPNPGPGGGSEGSMEFASGAADSSVPSQSNQAFLHRLHADMAHTLVRPC